MFACGCVDKIRMEPRANQGCHNGRPTIKIIVQTSTRVRIYPADAVLPADEFLPCADAIKTACPRARARIDVAWTRVARTRL
jgi:hypothetical protein